MSWHAIASRTSSRPRRRWADSSTICSPTPGWAAVRCAASLCRSGPILDRLHDTHAAVLAETGGRLDLAPDAAVPIADPTLLEEILLNLVDNAIAYRRPGVPPVVTVAAVPVAGGVRVSVADNGRRIAPELEEHVWEVFTRSTGEQDLSHAGIGLATVRRAARAMGAEVALASEVGIGSTFSLVLLSA
jgi:signal transduction histidine kinase